MQQDLEEEGMDQYSMQYRNNKPIIDALMNNPDGLFYMFDDATKNCEENCEYITSNNHQTINIRIIVVITKIIFHKLLTNEWLYNMF